MTTSIDAPTTKSVRWHDLDALRAIAMLLGIGLHAAMSFIPDANWVHDSQQHAGFGYLVAAIHGFRMPVFFLMSGFFTAMLWRRRGLPSMLKQRFRRVLLPLLGSMLIVLPLLILAFVTVGDMDKSDNMVDAAERGDIAALNAFNDDERDVNIIIDGSTALHAATAANQSESVAWLIENGADVNKLDSDGNTPLDIAEDKSYTAIALLLRENGGLTDQSTVYTQLTGTELFAHLWFLWHLWWLMIGFAIVVTILEWLPLKKLPSRAVLSPMRYVWLIPLTMIPFAFMEFPTIGPDTSTGLLPMPHVFGYYAIFFGFGALYYHYHDEAGEDTRNWKVTLPVGLFIVFPLALIVTFGAEENGATNWTVPALLVQAIYPWMMTFGLMGLFRHYFAEESKTMRYVSDSSYWLYLAHLPLIVAFQGIVLDWGLPAIFKYALICVVATATLLLAYEYLVRYRWLGTFLNGRRERPARLPAQALAQGTD